MWFDKIAFAPKEHQCSRWYDLVSTRTNTLQKISLPKERSYFCMGSCFAEEIRYFLSIEGEKIIFPRYQEISSDWNENIIDNLGSGRFHMNHYSTAGILQELRRATGEASFFPIRVEDADINHGQLIDRSGSFVYQDPLRRQVFSKTLESLRNCSDQIDSVVRSGLYRSKIFIITLGLIEIWKHKSIIFNSYPRYASIKGTYETGDLTFHRQTFTEVCTDLAEIIALIKNIDRENTIIFSVSPIPLSKTFSKQSVFEANCFSKSLLRAGIESVLDERDNVIYFPSYEIALNLGSEFYDVKDLRHARPEYVDLIVKAFMTACSKEIVD